MALVELKITRFFTAGGEDISQSAYYLLDPNRLDETNFHSIIRTSFEKLQRDLDGLRLKNLREMENHEVVSYLYKTGG